MSDLTNRRNTIVEGLHTLYRDQQLCDFTVKVEYKKHRETIGCHRNVLVVGCAYFRDKLLPGDGYNSEKVTGKNPEVVKETVSFLYRGECRVTEDTVIDLLELGKLWSVTDLVNNCFVFMAQHVSIDNFLKYYKLCLEIGGSEDVKQCMITFFDVNFAEMLQLGTIDSFNLTVFVDILSHSEVKETNANGVFDAVDKWRTANPSFSVSNLLQFIKYEHMTNEYLLDNVLYNKWLTEDERNRAMQVVRTRMKELNQPKDMNSSMDESVDPVLPEVYNKTKARITHGIKIFMVDTRRDYPLTLMMLAAEKQMWEHVTTVVEVDSWGFISLCDTARTVNSSQVVLAALLQEYDTPSIACRVINIDKKTQVQLPDLYLCATPVSSVQVLYTGSQIFVIVPVSYDKNPSSESYQLYSTDISSKPLEWAHDADFSHIGHACKSCPFDWWFYNGYIYRSGGLNPHCGMEDAILANYSLITRRYNLSSHTWDECANCQTGFDHMCYKHLQVEHEVHFFLPARKVTYDCNTNQWSENQYTCGELGWLTNPVMSDDGIVVMTAPDQRTAPVLKGYDKVHNALYTIDVNICDDLYYNSEVIALF